MNPSLQLLKAKRSSALIDARKVEAQLSRLTQSVETAGIRSNLRCIARMFREYIASLDEAIKGSRRELR
jgi:hypothetical protein